MQIFNLPDLGEGLPDAEIHEWFVKEGDTVELDQPLVSMETAKAVVDVPSPQAGTIEKLFGQRGDVIQTGNPLVGFTATEETSADKGTVVGQLSEDKSLGDDDFVIGSSVSTSNRPKTTPAVRTLAKKLSVNLADIQGTGDNGFITQQDVKLAAEKNAVPPEGFEPLQGVRRAMLHSMVQSHQEVVPVSIFDEVDIEAWAGKADITVRLIRAVCEACIAEPALNAWFNTKHAARKLLPEVNLGLAMDSDEGLFVPVIHHAASLSDDELRGKIDAFKTSVRDRSIPPEELKGSSITLSNFGKFAGRYASPIIVPPTVAILAVGRLYTGTVHHENEVKLHRLLPLSLSFDHRAVTGGEATRFLGTVMASLGKP